MKCNTPIDPNTKLALQGDALEIALKDPQSPRCEQELSDDDTFCPSCGAKVSVRTEIQDVTGRASVVKQGSPTKETAPVVYSKKRRNTYALLVFFFGSFGVHNVYAGRYKFAIAQLVFTTIGITIINLISLIRYYPYYFIPMSLWLILEMLIIQKDGKGLLFIGSNAKLAVQVNAVMAVLNNLKPPHCACGQELSNDDVFCSSCGAKVCSRTKTQEKTGISITKQGTSTEETYPIVYSNKWGVTYRLLAFVFGCLGVHNFYVGRYRHAIGQLSLFIVSTIFCRTQIWLHIWPLFIPYWTWPIWEMFAVDKDNKGHTLKKGNQSQIVLAIILAIILLVILAIITWAGYCIYPQPPVLRLYET